MGVGGQGTLLAGRLLGEYAGQRARRQKVSEVRHGPARRQRGDACTDRGKCGLANDRCAERRCVAVV